MGSRSEEGKEGPTLLVAQATEHTPVCQSKASPWWPVATPHTSSTWASAPLSQGPPALPPAHPVGWHCPCSPDEDTKAPGEGRAEPHWPGYSVLCSDGGTAASPCPSLSLRREGSALFLHSIQVIGQEHSLPPAWPRRAWRARVGCTLRGCGEGRRAEGGTSLARAGGELEPWAGRWYRWGQRDQAGPAELSCCDRRAGAG